MSQSLDSLISLLTVKLSSITDTSTNGEDLLLISKAVSQINEVQNSEAKYQALVDRLTQLEGTVSSNNSTVNSLITENDSKINSLTLALNEHKANKNNPNNVTKNQVGLNLVANYGHTSDVNDSSTSKYALAKGVNTVWNKVEEEKFIDAPKDDNFYVRQNEKWVQPPETSPIGSVTAYYGEAAPKGWLALDGSIINKTEYTRLYNHIVSLRKAPAYENIQLGNYNSLGNGNNWINGINTTGDSDNNASTWYGRPALTFNINETDQSGIDQIEGNIINISGKYLHITNENNIIIRIEDTKESNHWSANFTVLGGTVEEAAAIYRHPARFNIYHSLADIPVSDSECFLPDTRDLAITGYNHLDSRKMGSFEQDAIRNITGTIQLKDNTLPNQIRAFTYGLGALKEEGGIGTVHGVGSKVIGANTYPDLKSDIDFDASRVVPVAEENRIKNINLLWIIKAYDVISTPEEIESQIIVDRVNLNTSKVEALEKEIPNLMKKEIKTYTTTIASATNVWVDTGIKYNFLSSGCYIVRVYGHDEKEHLWHETATGIMYWYGSETNENNTFNNISLHQSGHNNTSQIINLRTVRHLVGHAIYGLSLELSLSGGTNVPVKYDFTFLKLL